MWIHLVTPVFLDCFGLAPKACDLVIPSEFSDELVTLGDVEQLVDLDGEGGSDSSGRHRTLL
jgi:hypothetical protein